VNGSPAESVTFAIVALVLFQTPVSTTRRLPAVSGELGVTDNAVTPSAWALRACTKAGGGVEPGVTEFDGAEAGLVPIALVAVTVNV
jgi:hypothetical protein